MSSSFKHFPDTLCTLSYNMCKHQQIHQCWNSNVSLTHVLLHKYLKGSNYSWNGLVIYPTECSDISFIWITSWGCHQDETHTYIQSSANAGHPQSSTGFLGKLLTNNTELVPFSQLTLLNIIMDCKEMSFSCVVFAVFIICIYCAFA